MNPKQDYRQYLIDLARSFFLSIQYTKFEVLENVKRGLGYYTEDGFEILCPELGAQKQVAGGGRYPEGIGFAIGLDRVAIALEQKEEMTKKSED